MKDLEKLVKEEALLYFLRFEPLLLNSSEHIERLESKCAPLVEAKLEDALDSALDLGLSLS